MLLISNQSEIPTWIYVLYRPVCISVEDTVLEASVVLATLTDSESLSPSQPTETTSEARWHSPKHPAAVLKTLVYSDANVLFWPVNWSFNKSGSPAKVCWRIELNPPTEFNLSFPPGTWSRQFALAVFSFIRGRSVTAARPGFVREIKLSMSGSDVCNRFTCATLSCLAVPSSHSFVSQSNRYPWTPDLFVVWWWNMFSLLFLWW